MLKTQLFDYRYVPARILHAPEKVMVVLHGLGDSLKGFTWLPEALDVDDVSYLMVNAPDTYYDGYSWYDFLEDPHPGVLRSRKLLLSLIEELIAQGVPPGNLFLFGFSQGCLMAIDAGLRTPHVLGGICGVSGYMHLAEEYPAELSPVAKQQEFLLTHGTSDPVVPYPSSKAQYQQLKKLGVPLNLLTYDKDHTMLPQEVKDIAGWLRLRLSKTT